MWQQTDIDAQCARAQTMIVISFIDRLAYIADWTTSLVRVSGGGK